MYLHDFLNLTNNFYTVVHLHEYTLYCFNKELYTTHRNDTRDIDLYA